MTLAICQFLFQPGAPGLIWGLFLFALLWSVWYWRLGVGRKDAEGFAFEPRGPGSFEPLLKNYVWLTQFIIGIATGSIVLLAGTSVFKSGGRLPWIYASPLVLLSLSVIYGVCFLAFMFYEYESFLHGMKYTRAAYSRNTALGFACLLCFALGYLWLAFRLAET